MPLNILAVANTIQQFALAGAAIVEIVGQIRNVASVENTPEGEAKLQEALADLEHTNNALYAQTQAMLAEAAKR